MSTIHDPMTANISLHGLGFIQVQLQGNQRLHVWHPELPRRKCFEHSAIHNHRFNFTSRVLIGQQININVRPVDAEEGEATHLLYLHEGARSANGGRPWTPNAPVAMTELNHQTIEAGEEYFMPAYHFHRTEPGGDGRVATIMTKLAEGKRGAMSSCRIGIEPDSDFDRFQLSTSALWSYVFEVLGAGPQRVGVLDQAEQTNKFEAQLELLRKVEQMAAYYEAPKGFIDWVDHQLAKIGAAPNTVEPVAIQLLPPNMLDTINQRMNGGRCPTAGSLGECAAIDQVAPGIYEAYLYIWDHGFNDSATMAGWFHEAGAKNCTVSLTLYSDYNGDRNGQTEEGSREWVVTFSMNQATATGSPEGLHIQAQAGGA